MGKRIIKEPQTVVSAIIIGPLPLSKNKSQYILVFINLFTKWVQSFEREIVYLDKIEIQDIDKWTN